MTQILVDRCAPADRPALARLIQDWSFKPFAGHAVWAPDRLGLLCATRLAHSLESRHCSSWVARQDGQITGFTTLTPLPWDSEQLGFAAARIEYLVATGRYADKRRIEDALLATTVRHGAEQGIHHLSVRVDASDLTGLHALEHAGFLSIDGILTFAIDVSAVGPYVMPPGVAVRLAAPEDADAAASLARTAYVYDRFHSDPAITTERADALHEAWVRNSCTGAAADAVVLAEADGRLAGFVTCRIQPDTRQCLGTAIGTIVLVATDQQFRRRGIGRAITYAALDWFKQGRVQIVEVGTQLRNIRASRLYESCGFAMVGSSISLRRVLEDVNGTERS